MTDASVVAVGTPQSFRQQIARSLEVEPDEIGWVQTPTAAEEMLINSYGQLDVLVLSPEVTIYLSRIQALSPDGRSKAFSADVLGFTPRYDIKATIHDFLGVERSLSDRCTCTSTSLHSTG